MSHRGENEVFGILRRKKVQKLEVQLAITDERVALIKAELAATLIKLAGQTEDLVPLEEAEASLNLAREFYGLENAPIEICLVQVALGDMLLKLGREASDKSAILRAKMTYRIAITLASLQGDDALRNSLRDKVQLINIILNQGPKTPSMFRAA